MADRNQEPAADAFTRSTGIGTYNTFFREFGTRAVKTLRTSIVTDPPDGRIPALTPAAAEVKRRRVEAMKSARERAGHGTAGSLSGVPHRRAADAAVFLQQQLPDHADPGCVRRARRDDPRRQDHPSGRPPASAAGIRLWLGDSIGHWEGATLVVDTTNFNDAGGFYGDAGGNFGWDRNLHLVERSACSTPIRCSTGSRSTTPTAFTRPWKGELTMARSLGADLRICLP